MWSELGGRARWPVGGEPFELVEVICGRLVEEVIGELLAGVGAGEEIVGLGGVLAQLSRRLVERVLLVELADYLGYELYQERRGGSGQRLQRLEMRAGADWCGSKRDGIASAASSR